MIITAKCHQIKCFATIVALPLVRLTQDKMFVLYGNHLNFCYAKIFEGRNLGFGDEGYKGKKLEEQKWARLNFGAQIQGFDPHPKVRVEKANFFMSK